MQRCLALTIAIALLMAVTSGLARAGDGEALVTAFHANPKRQAVESKVTDDELRAIATRVAKLAAATQ